MRRSSVRKAYKAKKVSRRRTGRRILQKGTGGSRAGWSHTLATAGRLIGGMRAGSKRRNFGPGRVLNKRRKSSSSSGGGGELSKASMVVKLGSKRGIVGKLVRANEQRVINRWQAINPYMGFATATRNLAACLGGGAYALANYNNAGNTITQCPLHLYDITSTNNVLSGTYTGINPSWQMTWTGGNANFTPMFGDSAVGGRSGAITWNQENVGSGPSSASSLPLRRCLLDSVSAKLMCYGASSYPTKFHIDFVQFTEDWCHPDFAAQDEAAPFPAFNTLRSAFWESLTKKEIAHPIDIQNPLYKKYIKVIKSLNFTLQARLTNEPAVDSTVGHCKEVNVFLPASRILKFDWGQSSVDGTIINPDSYQVSTGQNLCNVEPKARIYMMVRATNTTNTLAAGAVTIATTPTYDLVLRQQLINLQ